MLKNIVIEKEKCYTLDEIEKARADVFLQEEIIKQFYPLAYKLASGFNTDDISLIDFDDKIQVGMIAIVEAIKKYDGSTLFSTYVNNMIRYYLSNERRKQCTLKNFGVPISLKKGIYKPANVVSIYSEVFVGERNNKNNGEMIVDFVKGDGEDRINNIIRMDSWSHIVNGLSEREKYCIEQVYLQNRTLSDISRDFKVTPQRVRQILNNAHKKIHKTFNNADSLKELLIAN